MLSLARAKALGLQGQNWKTFVVMIQLGAILAVVCLGELAALDAGVAAEHRIVRIAAHRRCPASYG